jgi:hypothetical protein
MQHAAPRRSSSSAVSPATSKAKRWSELPGFRRRRSHRPAPAEDAAEPARSAARDRQADRDGADHGFGARHRLGAEKSAGDPSSPGIRASAAAIAVADVLFGDANPGGRLPVTFYRGDEKLPPFDDYAMRGRTYRYFAGKPLYPFGYGLSYTQFAYSELHLDRDQRWCERHAAGSGQG